MANNLKEYQRADTMGKSHLELLIQVYDGAIASFRAAGQAYRDKNNQVGYEHLEKARRFLTHLYTTLDYDKGGEIAENLGKLYTFLITQIEIVQATKDTAKLDDSIKVLENLREGWTGLKVEAQNTGTTTGEPVAKENNNQMVFSG